MTTLFPTATRMVQGYDRVQEVASDLIRMGIWLTIEPALQEGYVLRVKQEDEKHLPPLKDWIKATNEELLEVAAEVMPTTLGTVFGTLIEHKDMGAPPRRTAAGFWLYTETFIPYPKDRA